MLQRMAVYEKVVDKPSGKLSVGLTVVQGLTQVMGGKRLECQ